MLSMNPFVYIPKEIYFHIFFLILSQFLESAEWEYKSLTIRRDFFINKKGRTAYELISAFVQ